MQDVGWGLAEGLPRSAVSRVFTAAGIAEAAELPPRPRALIGQLAGNVSLMDHLRAAKAAAAAQGTAADAVGMPVAAKWGLKEHVQLLQELDRQLQGQQLDASQAWAQLCSELLVPEQPLELHQQLYAAVYASWDVSARGPAPVWVPDQHTVQQSNTARFMQHFQGDLRWEAQRTGDPSRDWPLLQQVSCANPNVFWAAVAKELGLQQGLAAPPSCMLQEQHDQPDKASWLPGARLNIAACALHSPRAPSPSSPAITWADEGAPTQLQHVSWAELRQRCMQVAACVAAKYQPGDALAIAMPLTVEAAVIYFGIVLAGCVVVSIADSFAASEVAVRLRIAGAVAVFTQDVVLRGGKALPLYSRVTGDPAAPPAVVVPAAGAGQARLPLRQGDMPWRDFLRLAGQGGSGTGGSVRALPHVVAASAYSNILFSSGTTGGSGTGDSVRALPLVVAANAYSNILFSSGTTQGDMLWRDFLQLAGQGGSGTGGSVCALPHVVAASAYSNILFSSGTTGGSSIGSSVRALPHVVAANAYSNILFSSGTTGEPKAIPWTHTTPLRCAVDGWSLQDIQPGNVVAWPTNLGWMMGPWLLYASLLNGATIALYQGSPLGRDFGEFVAAARVNILGLVPSIAKAWRSSGCMAHLDWNALKCFSSTGEASSPEDYHWLASRVQGYRPVIEYCGGTEIGGGFLAGCLLQPQAPSTFSTPTLGASLVLLSEEGSQHHHSSSAAAVTGELALVPPMLGMSQQLLHKDHTATYYAGMPACQLSGKPLRRHGDEVARLAGGYYRALGRVDDTMNLGGIKVSSVELERVVLANVPGIAEAAAIGIPAPGGGPELLHMFLVLNPTTTAAAAATSSSSSSRSAVEAAADAVKQLQQACQAAVRAHLNPLFKVERVLLVPSLPRTASNKVMRRVLRSQAMQQRAKL
ncbi:hypothetical protein OEZ86_013761 [Tetradesmus obliquus]|nr:hypothetical protein OEZ86_013761 [Tetradesmus obliquus]